MEGEKRECRHPPAALVRRVLSQNIQSQSEGAAETMDGPPAEKPAIGGKETSKQTKKQRTNRDRNCTPCPRTPTSQSYHPEGKRSGPTATSTPDLQPKPQQRVAPLRCSSYRRRASTNARSHHRNSFGRPKSEKEMREYGDPLPQPMPWGAKTTLYWPGGPNQKQSIFLIC